MWDVVIVVGVKHNPQIPIITRGEGRIFDACNVDIPHAVRRIIANFWRTSRVNHTRNISEPSEVNPSHPSSEIQNDVTQITIVVRAGSYIPSVLIAKRIILVSIIGWDRGIRCCYYVWSIWNEVRIQRVSWVTWLGQCIFGICLVCAIPQESGWSTLLVGGEADRLRVDNIININCSAHSWWSW